VNYFESLCGKSGAHGVASCFFARGILCGLAMAELLVEAHTLLNAWSCLYVLNIGSICVEHGGKCLRVRR